jgi:hypothetical protein
MKTGLYFIIALFLIIFISGCEGEVVIVREEKVECNNPLVKIGNECCFDGNINRVCDNKEEKKSQVLEKANEDKFKEPESLKNKGKNVEPLVQDEIGQKEENSKFKSYGGIEDNGDLIVRYAPTSDPTHLELQKSLKGLKIYEDFANDINTLYDLPRDIIILISNCKDKDILYYPESSMIKICQESHNYYLNLFLNEGYSEEEAEYMMSDATYFDFFNRLAVAMIDVYGIEMQDLDEVMSAAAQLGPILMYDLGYNKLAIDGAIASNTYTAEDIDLMIREGTLEAIEGRFHDNLCMIYGSNPGHYDYLVDYSGVGGILPESSANACKQNYNSIIEVWIKRLTRFVKEDYQENGVYDQKEDKYENDDDRGDFNLIYEDTQNPDFIPIKKALEIEEVFEDLVYDLNKKISLPVNIPTFFAECDEANAWYDPQYNEVVVCYDLMDYFLQLFLTNGYGEEEAVTAAVDIAFFVFYHELGHALIEVLDLPFTGNEEDAVDQLSTAILISYGMEESAANAAVAFGLNAEESASEPVNIELLWDQHSLDGQRFYNILCWIYGSDEQRFSSMVSYTDEDDGILPESRAQTCGQEYDRMSDGWANLIVPHAKPEGFE